MRLGVFGGTFNPIHYGHLRAAEEARVKVSLDKVIFVPSASPPLKSGDLADIEHRFLMTAMAVQQNGYFEISDIECRKPDKSYTVMTARVLGQEYPDAEIFFILGVDAFMEIPQWREPDELISLVDFIIIGRPTMRFASLVRSPYLDVDPGELEGLDRGTGEALTATLEGGRKAVLLGIPLLDISSTAIRALVGEGRSMKYLLPEMVESFIMSNRLYMHKQ